MIATQGESSPLGLSITATMANFAVFSKNATAVTLGLFSPGFKDVQRQFPMHRTGDIWHIRLTDVPEGTQYAYKAAGPFSHDTNELFNENIWLADPYAKILDIPRIWGAKDRAYRTPVLSAPTFDWEAVTSPNIKPENLVIYEMHVRGFTQHPSANVENPGTYLGLIEKIPYLKKLGINAVQLMPVFEFDEIHSRDLQPQTGEPLPNYWGYNTLFFFAPMRRFAATNSLLAPIHEFKTMVKKLHKEGIEVFLDVVFNHTGEGNERNYYIHFRGLDNRIYYMVDEQGHYRNFTGCGNTVNCNHPDVQTFIVDCLKYWIEEMHIDGFRFDLASIFTRDLNGYPLAVSHAPVLEAITNLCKDNNVKLIAEAWDAGGLYQVGLFPNHWKNWSDWNGKYRDSVRRFIKGTPSQVGAFADSLMGSQSIYGESGTPLSSINLITAHDGFCLRDLVTYQMKHNYDNGEMNNDGCNSNDSWNCGAEGPTINPGIATLRERQMRNFLLALFLSQGVPMILMGDEYGHTRKGNNNPFVQDNEINWFLWNILEKNEKIFNFVSSLIAFRTKQNSLKHTHFLSTKDVSWHGINPDHPDWGDESRFLAFTLVGSPPIYAAFNAFSHPIKVTLPPKSKWKQILRTDNDWDAHCLNEPECGTLLTDQVELPAYSSILCFATS